jgi:hypothetical protein
MTLRQLEHAATAYRQVQGRSQPQISATDDSVRNSNTSETENLLKKRQLSLLHESNVGGAPPAVPLILKAEVLDVPAVFLDLIHDGICLADRDDWVLFSVC